MAAHPEPLLMTVEQYRSLPAQQGQIQELHWGQVVTLTRPKMVHIKLQHRLVELLHEVVSERGVVVMEFPFRALPEYELRGADVAYVSHERWAAVEDDDNLQGSPEWIIEVLSRSNTQAEMNAKAALYLSTGCLEFWIVHPKKKEITVMRRGGGTILYDIRGNISLSLFEANLNVQSIFSFRR